MSLIGLSKKKSGFERRYRSWRFFEVSRNQQDESNIVIMSLNNSKGEGEGEAGERRERPKSRNMYTGPMDKDKGVGILFGRGVGWGRGEQWGDNGDNCN